MSAITEELVNMENRHRKEKKELQALIQALKKAAKNDKTKKKELVSEITRLESEMDVRHKQEMNSIEIDEDQGVEDEVPIESENSKVKLSKAQKRRDKKSQQEKEREHLIKQQELENLHGPRNSEIQAINSRLTERNLTIFSIPSDGDCLYKAVSHQMYLTRKQDISVDNLRRNVADYVRQNKEDFLPFMSNPDTCEMPTDSEFQEYCDKIEYTKTWGGQLEIRALSNSLKCPISVIQAMGPASIEQGTEFDGPPLIITYHRHMYKLGEHYNSTLNIENLARDGSK